MNVASMAGHLSGFSPKITDSFISASTTSPEAVTSLMEKFAEDVKNKRHEAEGWKSSAYAVSKAGLIAATTSIALSEKQKDSGVLINACCPGYVNTDMSKGNGTKTVDEGAKTPVLLALGDYGNETGRFWQHEKIIKW